MPIDVKCTCGKSFTVADELAGRVGTCKACGEKLTIPGQHNKTATTTRPVPTSTKQLSPKSSTKKFALFAFIGVIALGLFGIIAWGLSGGDVDSSNGATDASQKNEAADTSSDTPSKTAKIPKSQEPVPASTEKADKPKAPDKSAFSVHGEMYLVRKDQSDVGIKNTGVLLVPRDNALELQVNAVKMAVAIRVLAKDAVAKVEARLNSKEWMDTDVRLELTLKKLPILKENKQKTDKALENAVRKLGEMFKERIGDNSYNTVSDRNGAFAFEKVPPGKYLCNAAFKYLNSVVYFNVPVDVEDGDVKLTLSNDDAIVVEP